MGPDVHCSATVAALTEARVSAPVRNNANFDELRQQRVSARNRPDHATSRYSWMRLPRTSDRRSSSAFDVADQARSHVGLGWWALTEGPVRTVPVVVLSTREARPRVASSEDGDAVEAFSLGGAHEPVGA